MTLLVVSSEWWTFKCKGMTLDDRDVLIVVEGTLEPIMCEVTQYQVVPM